MITTREISSKTAVLFYISSSFSVYISADAWEGACNCDEDSVGTEDYRRNDAAVRAKNAVSIVVPERAGTRPVASATLSFPVLPVDSPRMRTSISEDCAP